MSNIQQTPPGWHPDPYQRYAHRWFDGTQWTGQVAGADGSTGTDPSWGAPAPAGHEGGAVGSQGSFGHTAASGSGIPPVVPTALAAGGSLLILLGMFALPWITTPFGGSLNLTDLTGSDAGNSRLFVTSKIFWQGGVYGALVLTICGAVLAVFRPAFRILATAIAALSLLWLLSVTLVTIGKGLNDSLMVNWNWFDGWGVGLWMVIVGIIVALVSTLVPLRGPLSTTTARR